MKTFSNSPLFWKSLAKGAGLVSIAIGVTVLIGWLVDSAVLKSVHPSLVAMKANTALGFCLSGWALYCKGHAPALSSALRHRSGQAGAGAAVLLGLLTLVEYLGGVNLGIDQLLFYEPPGMVGTLAPGRMAPTSALCFVFIGVALLANGASRQGARLVFTLAVLTASLALSAGLGFLYAVPHLTGLGHYTQMAVPAVFGFLVLAAGMLCLTPDRGLIALITNQGTAGVVTRLLLPIAITLPVLLEYLNQASKHAGIVEAQFGVALVDIVTILSFTALIVWVALSIARAESERGIMQEALRESEELYRSLFENMLEGYAYCHMRFVDGVPDDFVYLKVNASFERLTGLKNVAGSKVSEVIPGIREANPGLFEIYGRVALSGKPEQFETYVEALAMWFSVSVYSPEREYFIAIFDVITTRKQAEAAIRASQEKTLELLIESDRAQAGLLSAMAEQKKTQEALQSSERRFRALIENASDITVVISENGQIKYVSPSVTRIAGYQPDELVGKIMLSLIHPDEQSVASSNFKKIVAAAPDAMSRVERRYRLKDGSWRTFEAVGKNLLADPAIAGIIINLRDITERKQAEDILRLADRVFRSTIEGIAVTDTEANIVAVNPAFEAITGYRQAEVLGKNLRLLQSGRQDQAFYRELWAGLLATGQWRGELWNRRKDGEAYPEWLTISTVKDAQGRTTNYVGVFSDISSVKQAQQQIEFLTHHDALTRLPNRALLKDRLNQGIQRAQRESHPLALLYLGLDHFKDINETLGHAMGDSVLREVAQRLVGITRAGDTLARLSGDEFVLLLEDDEVAQQVAVARKLLELFATPVRIDDQELAVTASIGISLYPDDGIDADTLLKHADRAMHNAKTEGRNTYRFFDPALSAGVLEHLRMEKALRSALAQGQLLLHYQPQVDLYSGEIVALEALLRWQHPDKGLLLPSEFIKLAEETELIVPIGAWVLATACRQLQAWHGAGRAGLRMAINVSALQFTHGALVETMAQVLHDSGLDGRHVELELTESLVMLDFGKTQALLRQLKQLGVWLAIDNFGLGQSSLTYLKHFPIDKLKIDKSFIAGIANDPDDAAIVQAIIAMGHSLGLKLIAEGVETEAQVGYLHRLHCDEIQGFHFSRALPAEAIPALLAARKSLGAPLAAGDGRVLLLVDDEANILSALKRLLRRDGYQILTAASAEEGLELLARHKVGVLLSDQRMPGMSGTEFLSRVKVMYPNIIRMILSGYTDVNSITEAINRGEVYKFLTKPWEDEPLRAALKEAFMHYETAQDAAGDN
ncbi:MAG: EAL domain-containing protein [Betaproteobacteria bacterium]|nr:EAL domain-containing protein [Betaproteobacteria bacterium]